MPLYKLFSTARSYSLSMIKNFLHHMVTYFTDQFNFTHASPILCSKSLHLHLYFLGSHLYIYKWFYIFYFLFSGLSNTTFFISIHCANNTRPYHTIIFQAGMQAIIISYTFSVFLIANYNSIHNLYY